MDKETVAYFANNLSKHLDEIGGFAATIITYSIRDEERAKQFIFCLADLTKAESMLSLHAVLGNKEEHLRFCDVNVELKLKLFEITFARKPTREEFNILFDLPD